MTGTGAAGVSVVPLNTPWFDRREQELVNEVLRSGWVTQGPVVERFEQAVATFTGADHAVAVTSATTGLFAALSSLGLGPGDEVICPSFSYIATANAVVHAGAVPVFVDVDPEHWSIDTAMVEAAITPRTAAVLPVHMGWSADAAAVHRVADRHGLAVVEDAAPALGARYAPDFGGRRVGDSSAPVVLSFHPRKIITTGEGGMVLTNDTDLARRLRLLRHHHMGVSDLARHTADSIVFETYEEVGYNLRMTDLQAAVGVAQMEKLPEILSRRATVAHRYDAAFSSRDDVAVLRLLEGSEQSFQSYVLILEGGARTSRDGLMDGLRRRGITTRRAYMCSHLEPAHAQRRTPFPLPVSERLSRDGLLLPLSPQMDDDAVARVVGAVSELLSGG